MKVGLVIMASGQGKRFGGNKLMTPFGGKPLVQWILDVTEGIFDERVVVTRNEEVRDLCGKQKIPCIIHDLPYRSDTVRLGLGALQDRVDYCFFAPGDQPLITRKTLCRLVRAAREGEGIVVRPAFAEIVGAPVGFPRALYEELLNLPEGKGGGFVAGKHPTLVRLIPADRESELMDIDTKEDLENLKKRMEAREK